MNRIEKKPYARPVLVRREKLGAVTAAVSASGVNGGNNISIQ